MSVSFRLYPQNGTRLSYRYMLGEDQLHLNYILSLMTTLLGSISAIYCISFYKPFRKRVIYN